MLAPHATPRNERVEQSRVLQRGATPVAGYGRNGNRKSDQRSTFWLPRAGLVSDAIGGIGGIGGCAFGTRKIISDGRTPRLRLGFEPDQH